MHRPRRASAPHPPRGRRAGPRLPARDGPGRAGAGDTARGRPASRRGPPAGPSRRPGPPIRH